MSSKSAYIYQNELPEMPADPILPKFTIPEISGKISEGSELYNQIWTNITPDPFLGIPIELTDLSIYNEPVDSKDLLNEEVEFLIPKQEFSVPQIATSAAPVVRPKKTISMSMQEKHQAEVDTFEKSKQIIPPNAPGSNFETETQKQLKAAFGGKVPPGKIYLFKKGEVQAHKFIFKGKGDKGSAYTPGANIFLEARARRVEYNEEPKTYIKEIEPISDSHEHEPLNGYEETEVKDSTSRWALLRFEESEDGAGPGTVLMTPSDTVRMLKRMTNRERKLQELTAKNVNLIKY